MKSYKTFITEKTLAEKKDHLAFSYNDGGSDQVVIISGSPSQIDRVRSKMDRSMKEVDVSLSDSSAQKISASDWLKI